MKQGSAVRKMQPPPRKAIAARDRNVSLFGRCGHAAVSAPRAGTVPADAAKASPARPAPAQAAPAQAAPAQAAAYLQPRRRVRNPQAYPAGRVLPTAASVDGRTIPLLRDAATGAPLPS